MGEEGRAEGVIKPEEIAPGGVDYKANYPSYEAAFPMVGKAYDWLIQRIDSKERTLVSLATWITTTTLAFVASAPVHLNASMKSPWLYFAGICFLLVLRACYDGLVRRMVMVLDPMKIHQDELSKDPAQFQVDMMYAAGEAYGHNSEAITYKMNKVKEAIGYFVVEAVFFAVWVISSR